MTRRLLIDADVVAYQCASRLEEIVEWEPGFFTWNVSMAAVQEAVKSTVAMMQEKLDAPEVLLALSDPHANFRNDVLPSYKSHRKHGKRPLVLYHIKDWMIEELDAVMVPTLEGDDILGIMATRPSKYEEIVVSLDKDLKTIPCNYVRTKAVVDDMGAELVGSFDITVVTEEEADKFWMAQTLAGDVTDGYDGCPGIGMSTAEKLLEGPTMKVAYEHELKRGARKGQTEIRYSEEPAGSLWEAVVSNYEAKDLTEEDALAQARVARILRYGDYDFKTKEVKLWTPPQG